MASGRRLVLYIDNGGVRLADKPSDSSEKPASEPASKSTAAKTQVAASGDYISYKVKSGDSLYTISKKYPGVTAQVIQETNGLPNSDIRPGQVLKIPVV